MAKQDAFTAEEWTLLRLAPSLVSGGMAAADPSGIFSSIKEAAAGAQGMAEAFKASSALELFSALAADRSMPQPSHQDRLRPAAGRRGGRRSRGGRPPASRAEIACFGLDAASCGRVHGCRRAAEFFVTQRRRVARRACWPNVCCFSIGLTTSVQGPPAGTAGQKPPADPLRKLS